MVNQRSAGNGAVKRRIRGFVFLERVELEHGGPGRDYDRWIFLVVADHGRAEVRRGAVMKYMRFCDAVAGTKSRLEVDSPRCKEHGLDLHSIRSEGHGIVPQQHSSTMDICSVGFCACCKPLRDYSLSHPYSQTHRSTRRRRRRLRSIPWACLTIEM